MLPGCGAGGEVNISLEAAGQIVLEEIVQPDSLDHEVIVFVHADLLQPSDELIAYLPEGFEEESGSINIAEASWFFWIEDAPAARFAHPNRFVLVSSETGEHQVFDEEWWPVLDGEGLWVEEEDYWDENNWLYTNLVWRPVGSESEQRNSIFARTLFPVGYRLQGEFPAWWGNKSPGSAIVINGWRPGETDKLNMELDADTMHDVLSESGFDTTFFGPEQALLPNPDRDHLYVRADINRWFSDKAGTMKAGETLVVYLVGHGSVLSDGTGNAGGFYETEFVSWLSRFDEGVHIIVVIDACFSGSFHNGLAPFVDIVISATDSETYSYGDLDPDEDPDPTDRGGEFSSGFAAKWREIIQSPSLINRVEQRSEALNRSFWQALSGEAFEGGRANDAALLTGKTTPQRSTNFTSHLSTIGDRVWLDSNQNGLQDAGEPGVPNVVIDLINMRTGSIQSTQTDADGIYFFTLGSSDEYQIRVSPPSGYGFTLKNVGPDNDDSDVYPSPGAQPVGYSDVFAVNVHNPPCYDKDAGLIVAEIAFTPTPFYLELPEIDFLLLLAEIAVIADPSGHSPYIDMPSTIELEVSGGSINITGPAPWVAVSGEIASDGSFTATGVGTVAGYPGISVSMQGSFTGTGELDAKYSMGINGGLPGGQSITYSLSGQVELAGQSKNNQVASQEEADWVREFAMQLEAYNHAPAPDELVRVLHPEIIATYGEQTCLAYADQVADDTLQIDVVTVYGLDTWEFSLDGVSYSIRDVYTVDAIITRDGESSATQTHFGLVDGDLTWFTDCGEPLN
jgi:hypothetical protein